MAYENIRLQQGNFCRGPQVGTICSIDTTNPQTILKIKNTAGSTIVDYTLSSNIITENPRIEYVGPYNLNGIISGLTFFTFEKVNNSSCMIKRWETRSSYNELLLKEQVVKYTSGDNRYNAIDFAVEYYHRVFTKPNEYYNYLVMNNTFNIKSGTKLFIGPSNDPDNLGATENVTVSHIATINNETRVYLTSSIKNQYIAGDSISFYTHVYIYSSEGYAGDLNKGTLFKLDAYNWSVVSIDTKSFYKRVNASRWCPTVGAIASIISTNLLFVRPYDSYLNWRSMFLNNVTSQGDTVFPVYDLIFDNYSIYKLQKMMTLREDSGNKSTISWEEYNFHADTLLPYTNSIVIWSNKSILTGYGKYVDIYTQVRDQFHVGLRDIDLEFYKQGDNGAKFTPLDGKVTSDINGRALVGYTSGSTYKGHTEITVKAGGSSSSTGSEYVWTSNNIISYPDFDVIETVLYLLKEKEGNYKNLKQILTTFYKNVEEGEIIGQAVYLNLRGFSYFTTPGGNWKPFEKVMDYEPDYGPTTGKASIENYLPMLYRGEDHLDAPPTPSPGFGFSNWPWVLEEPDDPIFIGNMIKLTEIMDSNIRIRNVTDFLIYDDATNIVAEGFPPYVLVFQPDESSERYISQLKLGHHTHWVDGTPYDELWTYANIDQFIFVEDAIPKFWSEKNPVNTNIWLRLRPFAFSLDNNTFRMWIRELDQFGDTGYYEVTNLVELINFDAGGGILGLEVTYDSPHDYPYESTIFVKLEVYDISYIPNYIMLEYWFKITPDYRAPYLDNLSPDMGDINVPVDTEIYFEVKDIGIGVDIDTLEVLINSRLIRREYLNIEKVNRNFYKVTYKPIENLYYTKEYKVTVKVSDFAPRVNSLNTAYSFSTTDSTGVLMLDPTPSPCKKGMSRFEEVSVLVLGDGNGVDRDTIKLQVFNTNVNPKITPVIYRIS